MVPMNISPKVRMLDHVIPGQSNKVVEFKQAAEALGVSKINAIALAYCLPPPWYFMVSRSLFFDYPMVWVFTLLNKRGRGTEYNLGIVCSHATVVLILLFNYCNGAVSAC
jgi:hypothetical protein